MVCDNVCFFLFFKQKTAYELRISDWSSDVCSSDLVVVLLLDATLGLEAQDLRIADMALTEGRAFIIALNKWDVAHDQSRLFQGVQAALEEGLAQIKGVPLLTVSGKTGKGRETLMTVACENGRGAGREGVGQGVER